MCFCMRTDTIFPTEQEKCVRRIMCGLLTYLNFDYGTTEFVGTRAHTCLVRLLVLSQYVPLLSVTISRLTVSDFVY